MYRTSTLPPTIRRTIIMLLAVGTLYLGSSVPCSAANRHSRLVAKVIRSVVIVHARGGADSRTLGSGFCIRNDGVIVTALHVVIGGDVYVGVLLKHGYTSFPAKVVAADAANDIAILKVEASIPALHVSAASPKVGSSAAIIGFTGGP